MSMWKFLPYTHSGSKESSKTGVGTTETLDIVFA